MRLASAIARHCWSSSSCPRARLFAQSATVVVSGRRPAPDQHQRRLPPGRRPAGRRRRDRHALDLCRPGGRGAALAGNADRRARWRRAATRCSSAPARRTGSRRPCSAPATRSGSAPCSSAPAKSKARASGSPACRMRCAPSDADTLGGRPASEYLLAAAPRSGRRCRRRRQRRRQRPGHARGQRRPRAARHRQLPRQVRERRRRCRQLGGLRERRRGRASARRRRSTALHVQLQQHRTAPSTGLAVQNLGGTAHAYSGMLFYDQTGALGQFQGFNNGTHEYRINNIAGSRRAARSTARSTS